ncbi:Uncharacterised protein [Raoultella planticola]|nr:Uncharacterised protein [Raoultella planticola]
MIIAINKSFLATPEILVASDNYRLIAPSPYIVWNLTEYLF